MHVEGESARVGLCPTRKRESSVDAVTLPALGAAVESGVLVTAIVVDGTAYDVRSPVAGSVVLVNERLLGEPSLVVDDPFGAGWLFEVRLSYDEMLESVMDVDSYRRLGN